VYTIAAGMGQGGMCPRASRGVPKGDAVIFPTRNIQKNYVSSVEAGMGVKGQIMCIKQHILDVISSVSRSSKCTKIDACGALPRTPLGELTALPRPTSWVQEGLLLRLLHLRGGKRSGGRQNDLFPGRQNPSRFHWCILTRIIKTFF